MFGLFNRLGRSRELRLLDDAMRGAGVHPAMVPDAVKLTIARLLRQSHGITPETCADAANLVGYCVLGREGFTDTRDSGRAAAAERRIEHALEAGDSLDARLILLVLHARLMDAAVHERYGFESVDSE